MNLAAAEPALLDAATAPYRASGRFAYHFARGKLQNDPAFTAILEKGLLADRKNILDLGCGQGLLAAWLCAAAACDERGKWPATWPGAPRPQSIRGIDRQPREIERARNALGDRAEFLIGDIREADFGAADAIVLLDVLHYIDLPSQELVLTRVRAALTAEGVLLLRIGDASAGLRFAISRCVDHSVTFARTGERTPLYCRALAEWISVLGRCGFECAPIPMSAGTPFCNVLLVAKPA